MIGIGTPSPVATIRSNSFAHGRCILIASLTGPSSQVCGLRQKHWHGFGVNRPHNVIRFCGQECEEMMLACFALPLACPQAPYSGESEERTTSSSANQCVTFGGVSPFTK